jgi:HD-like signal output (HDOD) protein
MRIVCPHCRNAYNVPDELLPDRESIIFNCRKCGGQIRFTRPSTGAGRSGPISSGKDVTPREETHVQVPAEQDPAKVRALKSKIRMCLMGFIPPVAHVIAKAQRVMADPLSGLKDLVQVIETDQGITSNALRLANSAYYGLSGRVSSISHASVLLGNKIIGEIIATAGARGLLGENLRGYGLQSGTLWRHSLAVAVGSKLLAARKSPGLKQDAFVAGLLHDAGMIMLDPHIFERKEQFDEVMAGGQKTFLQAERMVLGLDHCEVGAEMFGEWGLPRILLNPVANHHRPVPCGGVLGYVVHLADIMARNCGCGTGVDDALHMPDSKALAHLNLDEESLTALYPEINESVEKMTSGMSGGDDAPC